MSKLFWRAFKSAPVIAVGSLLVANASLAQTKPEVNSVDQSLQQINRYQNSGSSSLSQVTNVNQLRDVSPADWAYEALRSLVDRYGCIAGFPNQTYRGNQALSRYEFAAGLNSCLNQIERLVASSEAVVREDIDTISRLTQEFEAELATLSGRVDDIESRTAFLEDNQFSTTTQLKGEVIFAIADTFGDVTDDDGGEGDPTQTTFSDRVRLNFDSSFYGKDRLRIRLQAANVPEFDDFTGFDTSRLGFDASDDNNLEINDLYYRFDLADGKFRGFVSAVGLGTHNVFGVLNPILASSGTGAVSRFTRRNPITLRGSDGAGFGAEYNVSEKLAVKGIYLTNSEAADPSGGEGLFNGSFSAGGQVQFTPSDSLDLALTYVYEFQTGDDVNLTGSTASELAQEPFGEVDTRAHQIGFDAALELGDTLVLSGFSGASFASEVGGEGDAILYTASVTASLVDFGKEGAALSVAGGIPPRLISNEGGEEDEDTTFQIDAQYKFPINDNIILTPGAFVILNPGGNSDNDTQVVGVIRTTFKF